MKVSTKENGKAPEASLHRAGEMGQVERCWSDLQSGGITASVSG